MMFDLYCGLKNESWVEVFSDTCFFSTTPQNEMIAGLIYARLRNITDGVLCRNRGR